LIRQNPGYFDIAAQDVSVWHVPNNMAFEHWTTASILRYHTENRFLTLHGGNLFHLFKVRQTLMPVLSFKHSQKYRWANFYLNFRRNFLWGLESGHATLIMDLLFQ